MPNRFKTALAVVLTVVAWSSAFPGIRAGLRYFDPPDLILVRFLVSSAAFLIPAALGWIRRPSRKDVPRLALSGFVGITLYQVLLSFGQKTVAAGAASLLVNAAPIWASLLGGPFLGERLHLKQWIGIAIGFAGVMLVLLGQSHGWHLGGDAVLVLFSSWAHGGSFVVQKPLLRRYRPLEVIAYTIWFGTLPLLLWLPGLKTAVHAAPMAGLWTAAYLGLVPAALGYVLWAHVLSRFSAAKASSFLYGVPVCSLAIAWVWLGEVTSWVSIAGGVVAMTGVALVHRRAPIAE